MKDLYQVLALGMVAGYSAYSVLRYLEKHPKSSSALICAMKQDIHDIDASDLSIVSRLDAGTKLVSNCSKFMYNALVSSVNSKAKLYIPDTPAKRLLRHVTGVKARGC